MIFYCTNCWKEIKPDDKICPNCGADQTELENESFVKKLIKALNHPEPETPIRAANILAQLKVKKAVPFLIAKLKNEKDPFIIEAVVKALLEIDEDQTKSAILSRLAGLKNPPVTIKKIFEELKKTNE
jgi:HEAT repeat protein